MINKKKNIDQLINESFKNDNFDFDNFDFDTIKNKLDKSTTVDKVVFTAMNPVSSQLPNEAWENMNDALDIETVWKRLEKRAKRKPFILWWKVAILAVVLSLISYHQSSNQYSSFLVNHSVLSENFNQKVSNSEKFNVPIKKKVKSKESLIINNIKNNNQKQLINCVLPKNKINKISKNKNFKNKTIIIENKSSSTVDDKHRLDKITKISPKTIIFIDTDTEKEFKQIVKYSDSSFLTQKTKKFEIGLVGEINNTWISDVDTRLGYSKSSLIYNDFSFASSYGLYLDYSITSKLSVGTEIFINSNMKTKNNLYKNSELTKKETNLEYYKSALFLSKALSLSVLKKNGTIIFLGGVYFSYLKRSAIKYNNVITKINKGYKLFDYGLKTGIYHKIDFNRINLSYGLQATYGLNNIFVDDKIPSYLNLTRNIAYGLNVKLGYRL